MKDRTGKRYEMLIVIGYSHAKEYIRPNDGRLVPTHYWKCVCDCGKEAVVRTSNLGVTKSCGCLQRAAVTKHGHYKGNKPTKTYQAWNAMLNRCRNPNVPTYDDYGGRGIRVCEQWMMFKNFLADVGEIPAGFSIDRIDNDGNYEPSNIRTATAMQQSNNTRQNIRITAKGKTQTVAEWSRETGIPFTTIWGRKKRRWADEDCILPSNSTRCTFLTVEGETKSIAEWSRERGFNSNMIYKRRLRGWPDEKCLTA